MSLDRGSDVIRFGQVIAWASLGYFFTMVGLFGVPELLWFDPRGGVLIVLFEGG